MEARGDVGVDFRQGRPCRNRSPESGRWRRTRFARSQLKPLPFQVAVASAPQVSTSSNDRTLAKLSRRSVLSRKPKKSVHSADPRHGDAGGADHAQLFAGRDVTVVLAAVDAHQDVDAVGGQEPHLPAGRP